MKRLLRILLILLIIVGIAAISGYTYMQIKYPSVGEAPDIRIDATPERVERGKYLFNVVCGCRDCHSTRDWTKYSGPITPGTDGKGGEGFLEEQMGTPGDFYSKNITPEGLKGWTDGEILRAITEGVSKDGTPLFPLMPYLNFGKMDKEDVYSIIAYMKTLPPIKNEVPESNPSFPFSVIMRTIPTPAQFSKIPDKSNTVAYGKYLLDAASCTDCHTQSEEGVPKEGMYLAGGAEFKVPGNIINRPANITPDMETGIGKWTKADFLAKFRNANDFTTINVSMGSEQFTVMPWTVYNQMTDEDLSAIYDYLRTVPPVKNSVVKVEKKLY